MKITKVNCPKSKYSIKCPYEMKKAGIVVHNTANDASAMAEVSYMLGNNNKVSFHGAIDDKRVVLGLPFERNSFSCGDGRNGKGNRTQISLEICYSKSGGKRFEQAEELAAEYIAHLLKKYNWGIDKVSKHQDYSKKYCPHRTLDLGWNRFLKKIEKYLNKTNKTTFKEYKVKINTDVLNVRKDANTTSKVITTVKKNEIYTIVEEKDGWGKLKSGTGWIKLSYAKKV